MTLECVVTWTSVCAIPWVVTKLVGWSLNTYIPLKEIHIHPPHNVKDPETKMGLPRTIRGVTLLIVNAC
jgi:hypothetical protein